MNMGQIITAPMGIQKVNTNGESTANSESIFGNSAEESERRWIAEQQAQWEMFKKQMDYNEEQSIKANERWKQNVKDYYKLTMDGLKEAGLNPTLLFGGGINANAPMSPTASSGTANFKSGSFGETMKKKEALELGKIISQVITGLGFAISNFGMKRIPNVSHVYSHKVK